MFFFARFKGFSLYFLYQQGNLIRIKTGLDTYLIRIQTRTPLSWYPPYDYSKSNGTMRVDNVDDFGDLTNRNIIATIEFKNREQLKQTEDTPPSKET